MIAHPPDRRLYLFSGCNNDRAPARQTTVSFFSSRNQNFPPLQKTIQQHNPSGRRLYLFFPVVIARTAHPTDRRLYLIFFLVVIARTAHPSDRRLYLFFSGRNVSFFFPVVMKISRHNKKTANFPPTDDCIFFFRS